MKREHSETNGSSVRNEVTELLLERIEDEYRKTMRETLKCIEFWYYDIRDVAVLRREGMPSEVAYKCWLIDEEVLHDHFVAEFERSCRESGDDPDKWDMADMAVAWEYRFPAFMQESARAVKRYIRRNGYKAMGGE